MTDTQRPWDRLTTERDPAYEAFAASLDTGSLRDAYRQRSGNEKATPSHRRDSQSASRHAAIREQRQRLREQLIQPGVLERHQVRALHLRLAPKFLQLRQWIGIDVSPTACRVMAKRLRDVCGLREGQQAWLGGSGFIVEGLPMSEGQLRKLPPFEFENWAVIAIGGIPNKTQVGDMGIDGRIFPTSVTPDKRGKATGHLDFMDDWYPVQVKQKDKTGRPDIDAFEAMMARSDRKKGFFVSFDYSSDAMTEIGAFFRKSGRVIVPLTVREILDEQIAHKLA